MRRHHRITLLLVFCAGCLGTLAAAEPLRLEIDPQASEIGFVMDTTWHEVRGSTRDVSGLVVSDSGHLFDDARVEFTVQAASIDTGNERRDRKMREVHLETFSHPEITFVSGGPPRVVSAEEDADGSYHEVSFTLAGRLTIHGVPRDVALSLKARRDGGGWRVTGEHPVRLSDHAITDPSIFFNRVQDEVTVTFSITVREDVTEP